MTKTMSIAGTTLELVERGNGRPLLFLHAGEGLGTERPWLELLSRKYRVIAPWHPGYGNSPLIDGSGSVDDLAYLRLQDGFRPLAAKCPIDVDHQQRWPLAKPSTGAVPACRKDRLVALGEMIPLRSGGNPSVA